MDRIRELHLLVDGREIAQNTRMRLRGRSTMTLRPDVWELTVIGITDQTIAAIENAELIEVEGNDLSLLCRGQVEEVYTHSENGKIETTVMISDGMDFWLSTVNLAMAGGNSVKDTIRYLVSRCTAPVPITAMQSKDATFSRGQAFHGRTAGYVATLAKSVKARAFFTRGNLAIMTMNIANDTVLLSEDDISGIVSRANGACIVKLAEMRGFPIGQLVQLPNDAEKYRLLCQSIDADSYQGVWQTELIMVEEKKIATGDDWGGG